MSDSSLGVPSGVRQKVWTEADCTQRHPLYGLLSPRTVEWLKGTQAEGEVERRVWKRSCSRETRDCCKDREAGMKVNQEPQ